MLPTTFVLTLLRLGWSAQSARHLTTHDGTKIDLLAVAPKTVGFWVDQATLVWTDSSAHWGNSKGSAFSGKPSGLCSPRAASEGWSRWHRNVLVKLVSRGIWTQERLARLRGEDEDLLPTLPRRPGHNVPPLLRVPCPAHGERHACLDRRYARRQVLLQPHYREQFAHDIFPFPGSDSANRRLLERSCPVVVAQPTPRRAPRGAHFHRRLFIGQWCAAACWLGGVGDRRSGQPQGRGLRGGAERRAAGAIFARWRRLCGSNGRAVLDGPAHAAYRLRRYHRHSQRPKVQSLGGNTPPSACLEQASGFPRPGQGGQSSGACHNARRGGRAFHTPVQKRGTDLADLFAKKGAAIYKPPFRIAKTVVACASLALQAARWAAEAHVLLRLRGWDDTKAAAPRTKARPARARLKRKFKADAAAPTAGKARDWLAPHVPSAISQDSLDPRSFAGTACNWVTSSMLGVGPRNAASSSAPSVGLCSGNGPTRCAEAASSIQVGARLSFAKSEPDCFPIFGTQARLWSTCGDPRWTRRTRWWRMESCEAGLGRSVWGPTTPKRSRVAPQAAELLHWARGTGAAELEDLGRRRWDAAHDGFMAAFSPRLGAWVLATLEKQLSDEDLSKVALSCRFACDARAVRWASCSPRRPSFRWLRELG